MSGKGVVWVKRSSFWALEKQKARSEKRKKSVVRPGIISSRASFAVTDRGKSGGGRESEWAFPE